MINRVEYHKQWRKKKKQADTQSVEQLLETVETLSAELKRFEPLLALSDEKLNEIIKRNK